MTHVLLFGGSGFIGGQVCRELRQQSRVSALTMPGRAQCDLIRDDTDRWQERRRLNQRVAELEAAAVT